MDHLQKQNLLYRRITEERKEYRCDQKVSMWVEGEPVCGPGCVGCSEYGPDPGKCDLRDNVIQALNEDAWEEEHDYLDPHPRNEED